MAVRGWWQTWFVSDEATTDTREVLIERLVEGRRLWPLLPHHACTLCALPRKAEWAKDWATCYGCKQARELYGDALTDLYPLTVTTKDWAVGGGLRLFKDRYKARVETRFALGFGAVLSAWLEAHVPTLRLGLPWSFGLITVVPSSKPAVVSALRRARAEGWWVPEIREVAVAREGVPRQRERAGSERLWVADKWEVDGAAVLDQEVLVLDDLYTTGGSMHSLAVALRQHGARSVRGVVLARNIGSDGDWALPLLAERHAAGVRWHPARNKYDLLH